MHTISHKKAFSMLTALFVIVIMSTIAAFVLSLSGKIVKSTTIQYQKEQAELYAKSYTEYAVLAVTGNNRAGNCLTKITGNVGGNNPAAGDGYRVTVNIRYIGTSAAIGTCTNLGSFAVLTSQTPLTILIDVYVRYKDPDNPAGPWKSVHRRTLQKI